MHDPWLTYGPVEVTLHRVHGRLDRDRLSGRHHFTSRGDLWHNPAHSGGYRDITYCGGLCVGDGGQPDLDHTPAGWFSHHGRSRRGGGTRITRACKSCSPICCCTASGRIARQHLAFLFWPDSTEEQARTNLRNLWHRLRRSLPDADRFLTADELALQWRADALCWLDVAEFETHLRQAESSNDVQKQVAHLEQAVAAYGGDLLPGFYNDWLLAERDRLAQAYGAALAQLVTLHEERRDYRQAIGHAQALLRHDPLHEPAYAQLMRLHALNDDRAAALHTYHTCATVLRRELDVEPSPATRQMYDRLLSAPQPVVPAQAELAIPLVGREAEWAQLQGAWREARGRPRLALISGEAGIGKTRLAEALVEWVSRQVIPALTAHCYPQGAGGELPYAAVVAWLRSHPRPALADPTLRELARLLPEILVERPDLPPPAPLTEKWQRLHLFEALTHAPAGRAQCAAAHPGRPPVVRPRHTGLAPLSADRATRRRGAAAAADRGDAAQRRERGRVGAGCLAGGMANRANPRSPTDRDRARSTEPGRHPGAGGSSGRTAVRPGAGAAALPGHRRPPALHRGDGARRLRPQTPAAAQAHVNHAARMLPGAPALPARVRQVLEARLAQLSPAARGVVELAAVAGRAFSFAVLAGATDLSEDLLVASLDECWRKRIIREQGEDAYDFSHDKLREAAYAGLSRTRRRWLHGRVAQALEQVHAADPERAAGVIAGHFEAAGQSAQAIAYYDRAAALARRIYAHADALAALERAIGLLAALPDGAARGKLTAHLQEERGDLLELLTQHGPAP